MAIDALAKSSDVRCTNRNESEVERVCPMAPRKARPGDICQGAAD
jgi:hypothetical protein